MMNKDEFERFHNQQSDESVLDIKAENFRMTDAEAKIIIKEVCGIGSSHDFLGLDIAERNVFIKELRGRGLSIRQISRVTGVSKGIIEKI